MSLIDERNSLHHQCSIVEKFGMHAENGRLARAKAGFDLLMQPVQLILGSIQCALEPVSFADRVAGIVGDDEGRLLLVLAHGANSEPAGSGNASNGRACSLRRPALTAAARSRGELLFWLIPKPYGNGRLEGIKGSGSIRALGRNANSRAMFDAQLQQGDEAFPIGDGITVTHFDVGLKALCQIDKGGGRTGMQSGLVEEHRV